MRIHIKGYIFIIGAGTTGKMWIGVLGLQIFIPPQDFNSILKCIPVVHLSIAQPRETGL